MALQTAQTKEVLLEARNITKIYDKDDAQSKSPVVLSDIDISISEGEFVALLGPSGSGKSTLLRILAGLLQPTQGEVSFKGQPQHGPNSHLAIVFQTFALFPWLTVLQNVELGLESQEGVSRTQRMKRSLAAIDTIGLDGFEDAYPKELSGGMRQRVGFARALVVEPELLFMDEPFSALDVLTAANLRKELMGLWRSNNIPTRAIVMVTHNIEDAVQMADRVLVLGANPGIIRVELPGLPLEQRTAQHEEYTKRVDLIYNIMTTPGADINTLLPAELVRTKTGHLVPSQPLPQEQVQVLPHAAISNLTGLIELISSSNGREDIYRLGRQLHMEVDDLLPLVDAANMLDLARSEEGDLVLTEAGKRFAEAGVLEEKQIFREQALAHVTILRQIVHTLEQAPNKSVNEHEFLEPLLEHFSEGEAWAQLETAVSWGRYAELFSYQEEQGIFRLEEEDAPTAS